MKKIIICIIVLGIIASGVAGLLFNIHPLISTVFLIFGTLTGVIAYLLNEAQLKENQEDSRIIAKMLSAKRLGNPYSLEYFSNMCTEPQLKNPEHIKKGYTLDPDDEGAVSLYCMYRALELSFDEWQWKSNNLDFKKQIRDLKGLIEEKMHLFQKNFFLYAALGIVLDMEGKHEAAREAFKKEGTLCEGSYWRISMATSFLKENRYDDALKELEIAKSEGLNHINSHFGKVYQEKGEYAKAEQCFRDALTYDLNPAGVMRADGWKAEVLNGISFNLYYQGKYIRGICARMRMGAYLLGKKAFARGMIEICEALLKLTIRMLFLISKMLLPIYEKFPASQIFARRFPPNRFEYVLGTRLLIEEKNHKAASSFLKKALEMATKLQWDLDIAEISLHLGTCYLVQNVFISETEALFLQSLQAFTKCRDIEGMAKAHGMLSEFHRVNSNPDKQHEHYAKSLEYFRQMGLSNEEIEQQVIEIESDAYH